MKAKKRFLSLLLCGAMLFSLCPQATFAAGAEAGGLCEHHPQHTAECGYTEGGEGTPCSHEHTEDCYTLVTECVHEHGPECYPEESAETAEAESVSGNTATPSEPEEQEPTACTHVCSEESGCITKKLDCQHEHDEACGYAPATEGTPCTYVCEICNPHDSSEAEETEPEAECICTELCTEETVNAECPVCGVEGADLTACEGVEAEIATLSNALAAEPNATAGAFEVTGGTSETDYSYSNGVLTVKNGANITISMTSGANTPTSDRIVVAENATATITLAGVNIKGSDCDGAQVIAAKSAIDLSNGSILTIDLSANTENTLTGGSGSTEGSGAPGIHVPDSASLIIQGEGSLSVSGGTSSTAFSGVGIGGNASTTSAGEACGTVICFASGNVTITAGTQGSGSVPADNIGGGNGQNQNNGDDGQGIRPGTDGNYTVYGDLELPCDITIPQGAKVVIPSGASLIVPDGTTLTNNGTILMQGGTFTGNGTVSGNQPTYPSKVTVSFSQNGQAVTSVPYGSTVTITATMEKAETATNALSADPGKVDFYLGDANDTTGMKMGIGTVEFEGGAYTASVDVTIGQDKGFNNAGTFKFTADFGGYAPEGDEGGDSLAPNTGSAQLTVTKAEQTEPYGVFVTMSSTENSIEIRFHDLSPTGNENGIEIAYAVGPTASEPTSNWTTAEKTDNITGYSATIGQLSPGTPYVFFARYKGDDTHEPSPPFGNDFVRYTRPKIITTSLPNAYVGVEYFQKLEAEAAEGVAVNWAIDNGSLPAGLTLNSDGTITGTPTTPTAQAVSITVTATVGNRVVSLYQDLTISVTKSDAELGNLTVTGQTGFDGHFQYGDTITVTFTPERKANTSTNALAENTATLTYTPDSGETVTLATATAQADGSFKLTYDTKEKKLPIGENLSLTVSYGGSGALNPVEETVTLSLDQAILKNMPTVTGSFVYGGTLTLNYTPQDDEEVTYQWWRIIDDSSTERIDGATGETYTLTESEIGGSIYIIVSATDEWHRGAKQSDQYQISKAPGSIVIACDSVTYGETVQPSVTNNTNTGADVTYSYAGTDGTSYGPSNEAPTNAGTYTVTATVAETATHTSAESEPVAFTISKATLTAPQNLSLTSTAPGKATAAWDEVQNASGYTVQLYKDGEADSNPTITTGTSCEFSIAEAGSYTVKVKANGSDNYTDSTEATSDSLAFYTVTVNGSYAQTGGTDVYTEGATVSIDAGTRAGYTFDGWTSSDGVTFADANSAQTTFTMPGKPVTVTASWVPNSSEVGDQEFVRYIVQHYKQNTDGSYRLEDAKYPIGEVGDTVTATARNYEGYTYNAEKSNASGTLTEIKSDADIVTLKLYYDLTVFTVTVETSGNGTASASPASATMGQTITLTAKAASGYHFVKWEVVSGDIVLNGNTFTMPAGNVTVKAVFERTSSGGEGGTSYDYFTISASAGEGGSISPAGNISVREGRDKTFTITPADGYVISDVRVDGVSVGAVLSYTFDNVQKRHTIEVFFAKENPDTGNPFTDVHPNDWFYNDVMFVYQNGLMNGTSATTFSPNDPITRAQVAVIFYRMAGSPEVTGDSAFTDVENGPGAAWYYNAVLWAQQNGIVSGYGDGTYHPEKNITREQLAVIFYNYAKLKGYDVSATNDLSGFTDAGDVSDWALPAMRWAVGSGIMGGYGDGILGPQGTATRAQVAAMLRRFIESNKLVPPAVLPGGDSGTTGTGGTGSGGGGWTQQITSPQTGDSSNIGLWSSLMLLSLSGIVVLLVTEKVRRRRMEAEEAPRPADDLITSI